MKFIDSDLLCVSRVLSGITPDFNRRPDGYERYKAVIGEKVWSRVLDRFPQLRDKVDFGIITLSTTFQADHFNMSSPLSLVYYLKAPSGSIASMAHNGERYNSVALGQVKSETDIENLWLTGESWHSATNTALINQAKARVCALVLQAPYKAA